MKGTFPEKLFLCELSTAFTTSCSSIRHKSRKDASGNDTEIGFPIISDDY